MIMGRITAIRKFADTALGEKVVIVRRRDDWAMSVSDKSPRLILPKDTQQNSKEDKLFRKDFIRRFKSAQGFANVTLSILHEVGHWMTRYDIDWDKYFAEQENVFGQGYFELEAERKASDWAIKWLSDPTNRKIAKAFEVEYFGH